ncbi:Adenylate cyclase 1 [Polystyrenella longa]|uniref:Adenylate cyclase 1 n=1 Tax=Polystyrenella longa TaxID=2528007 RepID=A0A518CQ33_9PLAN|nr:adenylate/guanylate cyclase domain-containing protein [Polystyrenella longa]QDU81304.1 Adenylate cyclase 1 [Polystyrenella longa]
MFELITESLEPHQKDHFTLIPGESYVIGRDIAADIVIDWDPAISRQHVCIDVSTDHIQIERHTSATNPIYYEGRDTAHCQLSSGGIFVIGSTRFLILQKSAETGETDVPPFQEMAFDQQELKQIRFRDADKRLEVLANLSEVIRASRTETDLNSRLVNLILAGVPYAEAVAIVELSPQGEVKINHWIRRHETEGSFRPSTRLIIDALSQKKRSILHMWEKRGEPDIGYTNVAEFDWAFCTPVEWEQGPVWGLYLAGQKEYQLATGLPQGQLSIDASQLKADVKFVEIVSQILNSVQRTTRLERQQAGFRQFFAPPILAALGDNPNTDLLEPRECDVTVLFCDLRGFSQRAEESSGDLIGLLDRVSKALGVMTYQILEHGGVTGDFQGDAALGFWGWPFASPTSVKQACLAALAIRNEFDRIQSHKDHPLAQFQMGIGIAHGRAVAGKIGTTEQVKVTVFGPVVNLASRLEGMTKIMRVPILVDETIARLVRLQVPATEARVRKLGRVLPYGFEKPLVVSELLPPTTVEGTLTDEQLSDYEAGVEKFQEGDWETAYQLLHGMPATDRAQDFLNLIIAQNNRTAPNNWEGFIPMERK